MSHKEKARKEFNKYEDFLEDTEFHKARKKFEEILENEEVSEENIRHCYERIFPMIAIYKTLKERNGDSLSVAEAVFNKKEVYPGIRKMQKFMKIPFLYKFIFPLMDKFMGKAYRQSQDGFQIETLEADGVSYKFKIHQCPYYNYCKKHEVLELCDVFCKSDDLSGKAMSPHIIFERESTIARGSQYCDFSYRLNKQKNK